jgi:hypothetical protein
MRDLRALAACPTRRWDAEGVPNARGAGRACAQRLVDPPAAEQQADASQAAAAGHGTPRSLSGWP